MKLYELTYLISPTLSPKEAKNFQEKINSLIQERGVLNKVENLQKRKLAYLIKKKSEAYLASSEFQLEPENLENLEKKLQQEENILRYLLIKKPKEKIKKITPPTLKKVIKPKKPKKVELKEIEEKLEEILKE